MGCAASLLNPREEEAATGTMHSNSRKRKGGSLQLTKSGCDGPNWLSVVLFCLAAGLPHHLLPDPGLIMTLAGTPLLEIETTAGGEPAAFAPGRCRMCLPVSEPMNVFPWKAGRASCSPCTHSFQISVCRTHYSQLHGGLALGQLLNQKAPKGKRGPLMLQVVGEVQSLQDSILIHKTGAREVRKVTTNIWAGWKRESVSRE